MFCRNCGAKNADDAVFCCECGAKLIVEQQETHAAAQIDNAVNNSTDIPVNNPINNPVSPIGASMGNQQSPLEPLKKIPKKIYAIATGVLALLIVLIVVYVNVSSTINLDKYVKVAYSGYDGYGTASVSIDWDSIEKKYGSKVKLTSQAKKQMNNYLGDVSDKPISFLPVMVGTPELDKYGYLNNGDKISYKWNIDDESLKNVFKNKIKYKDSSVEVSGLKKAEKFDAFKDLKVEFSGVGPDGNAELKYKGKDLDEDCFYCEDSNGLSNGDKVVVKLQGEPEYYAKQYGKIPKELKKTYKVKGLGKYATKLSDVDDDTLENAKKEAEKIVKDSCSSFGSDETLSATTYVGDYLEVAKKKKDIYGNKNVFGIVYKIDVQIQPENCNPTMFTYYYDVRYYNIVANDDKSCTIDYEDYETTWSSVSTQVDNPNSFFGSYYYYTGYESIDKLMNSRKEDSQTSYDTEWNIDGVDATTAANGEDYICAYSAEREITTDEINNFKNSDYSSYGFPGGRDVIQMIINEMYARHGYQFTDAELTNYFNQKQWYSSIPNKTIDMDGIYNNMSSVEQANVTLLQQYK